MDLTKAQQHDLIVAQSKTFHEELELLLGRKLDIIMIVHRKDETDGACETSVTQQVRTRDRSERDLVLHMFDEALDMVMSRPTTAVPSKERQH